MKMPYVLILVLIILAGGWYMNAKKTANEPAALPSLSQSPTESIGAVESTSTPGQAVQPAQQMFLTITTPADGITVSSAKVTVKGKTKPYAEVFVNDEEAKADASGNFSVSLTLDEGDNLIVVSVNDADGNVAQKELTVNYDSGK